MVDSAGEGDPREVENSSLQNTFPKNNNNATTTHLMIDAFLGSFKSATGCQKEY